MPFKKFIHLNNLILNKTYFSLEESAFDSNLSEEDYYKVQTKLTNLLNSVTKYAVEKYAQLITKHSSAKLVLCFKIAILNMGVANMS